MAADGLLHHCPTYSTAVSPAIGFCRNFLGQGKLQDVYIYAYIYFSLFLSYKLLRSKVIGIA